MHALEIEVAKALKAQYKCDGVSTRQHNEPHGNQDVWHYHLHIFPRYEGDNLYRTSASFSAPEDRIAYAQSLRDYFTETARG
ncbi:MAG: HIT domain-containing protein [Paenibacillus sp.]|nr:HIT domain-containing protein [Paenibacillus sp.]